MDIFYSHGEFTYKLKHQYIITIIKGPFNTEGVIEFTNQLAELSIKMNEKAQLQIKLTGLCLFTPEAEQVLTNELRLLHSYGIELCYVQFEESCLEFRSTIYRQIKRIFQNSEIPSFISPP